MLIDYLTPHYLVAAFLWGALYLCDYFLTLRSATVYLQGAHERIIFQRGLELNPVFADDIARRRRFSIRFFGFYTLGMICLIAFGAFLDPLIYEGVLGALLLEWITIDLRHIQNLWYFRLLGQSNQVTGKIEYTYSFSLRVSGTDLLKFAAIYLFCAVVTERVFFLGGAVACSLLALRQFMLARRAAKVKPV
ncbi:hypothetical protein BH10CHL1_BH10CHL1_12890 [soil metagenome]